MGIKPKDLYDNGTFIILTDINSNLNPIVNSLRKIIPNKNTFDDISLTNYYEEKSLPRTFVLLARDIDVVLPMYRENIASLIGLRTNQKKFTVLPIIDLKELTIRYKGSILSHFLKSNSIFV